MVHRVFNSAQYLLVNVHHVVNGGQYVNQMARSVDYSAYLVNTALESNCLKTSSIEKGIAYCLDIEGTRQKGLHKQLPSEVINALACFHCFYCWQNQTALKNNKKSSALLSTASAKDGRQ